MTCRRRAGGWSAPLLPAGGPPTTFTVSGATAPRCVVGEPSGREPGMSGARCVVGAPKSALGLGTLRIVMSVTSQSWVSLNHSRLR